MKHYLSAVLAAAIIAGLTACGGGAPKASPEPAKATPSASPTRESRPVPDVVGKPFPDARKALGDKGFRVTIIGKDGRKWVTLPDATVLAISTKPVTGTVTAAGDAEITVNITEAEHAAAVTAAADAARLAVRYEFTCGPYSTAAVDKYHSYQEVWASSHYAGSDSCSVKIDGLAISENPTLLPSEKAILDGVNASGGSVKVTGGAFGDILGLCAKITPEYAGNKFLVTDRMKSAIKGALALCPDAPHAARYQELLTAVRVESGTKVVGKTMEPGTYQTGPGAKDCYWSRTTGGGDIIANDFVGFAPDGVTVTVYLGEGFESERCGLWNKIG